MRRNLTDDLPIYSLKYPAELVRTWLLVTSPVSSKVQRTSPNMLKKNVFFWVISNKMKSHVWVENKRVVDLKSWIICIHQYEGKWVFSNKSCVRAFDPLKIVYIRICECVSSETGQMDQWLRLLALLWKPKSGLTPCVCPKCPQLLICPTVPFVFCNT